jgi:hypothetical protein
VKTSVADPSTLAPQDAIEALGLAIARAVAELGAAPRTPAQPAPGEQPRWLAIGRFAKEYKYSTRSVSRWVKLGMPHVGSGRNCRINVAAALLWIEDGGPAKAIRKLGADAHARALQ